MLPVEQGKGQIWLREQFLCDVEYVIDEPMRRTGTLRVQRILFTLEDAHCATLLNAYGLILVTEDKGCYPIPLPLQQTGLGRLECYVESRS
jgi:hypothetical protein